MGEGAKRKQMRLKSAVQAAAVLLVAMAAAEDAPKSGDAAASSPFYAIAVMTDHAGVVSRQLIGINAESNNPPELQPLLEKAMAAYEAAQADWKKRKAEYNPSDPKNKYKPFSEPAPKKPTVVLEGRPFKNRSDAEAVLEKHRVADMLKADPGKAARQKILQERILDHFCIGVEAPIEWMNETRDKFGAKWDIRTAYFSGGADKEPPAARSWDSVFWDNQWENPKKERGVWARKMFIKPTAENNYVGWITMYNLAQANPANYKPGPAQATPINAKIAKTMKSYWEQVKLIMQLCKEQEPKPFVIQVEPDEWGHLLLSAQMDPLKVDVKVGSTGVPELKDLPDNMIGYAKAWKLMRDLYAPNNVLLATNPSAWDWQGALSPAGWAKALEPCGVYEWDLAVYQFHDGDQGRPGNGAKPPPYQEKDLVTFQKSWDALFKYLADFHKRTGLWIVMWQVPLGNTYFRTCDNSAGHGTDGLAQALLEDYPKNDMIARFVQAGCCGWIFFGSNNESSHPYDAKKDGITNPDPIAGNLGNKSEFADDDGGYLRLRGAAYYKKPFPILGKPAAVAASSSKTDSKPTAETKAVEPPKPAVVLKATPQAVESWAQKLQAAARAQIAAGKKPAFELPKLKSSVVVNSLNDKGEMSVTVGGGSMNMSWKQFDSPALLNLALALLAKEENAQNQALAAFYVMLNNGDQKKADDLLAKAGADLEKEVRAAFAP
ncbi:MAG TPA: hypothetical protein VGP72_23120 [Planctomycetota bacterium]|jgi:hypothetical protein